MSLPSFAAAPRVRYHVDAPPAAAAAADVLHQRLGAPAPRPSAQAAPGLTVTLGDGGRPLPDPPGGAWIWVQVDAEGNGRLAASTPAFLYALPHLLADGALDARALADGLLIEPAFSFHRPLYDHVLTQVSRTVRGFDPEPYVERIARSGFTHLEVNGLAFHIPFEPGVPTEFYNQFYSYGPGFNHFVESPLTRGYYPAEYLQANLNRLRRVAALGRKYGLRPGLLCFEPRSLPEPFFQRHPTLRGARIDHPFRSHHPRYTLAQDHPAARDHYRQVVRSLMEAVPDLDYLSVWTNDSGAGFEHTASLYVGRNGGPYMIREWHDHDRIAETAGRSAVRWLRLIREAAAEVNPGFEVILRIEPFKVEHDVILDGLGEGLSLEAPSLLVRGYDLPYHHPRYPDQTNAAGTLLHTEMDEREAGLLEAHRARGLEPKLTYSAASSFNMEPLLGIPYPRMLHAKLAALRRTGFRAVSAMGGLLHVERTPYWPHPEVIRAAQFTPERDVDEVLRGAAEAWAGPAHAGDLVAAWDAVEEAVSHLPLIPLYSNFGFVWLRTWVRPLVPDIGAIPAEDRLYYERFMVSTANNPNIDDLGRDVLFRLLDRDGGRRTADRFDAHVLPRLTAVSDRLDELAASPEAGPVFADLRDRTRALACWATTQRNTCAWVAGVYGYREATTDAERADCAAYLQETIDLDLENTRRLLRLWEASETEFMLVSDVGETSFIYGENFGDLLRRKLALTEAHRHHAPRIDDARMWKLP